MNVVIMGGSGLIGKKLAALLQEAGHAVTSASPSSGVDAVTGEGLAEALHGAEVVVDVTNSPSFEDAAVLRFFEASTSKLLAAEAAAGVGHHVALSVVGAERLPDSGYLRAKLAQEALIQGSAVPYSILRATQFFEFVMAIAQVGTHGQTVRLPQAKIQPVAANDVARALADAVALGPSNGIAEVAGPEVFTFEALVADVLKAKHDPREVMTDADATYFGARLADKALTAGPAARIGKTTLAAWLAG